MPVLKISSHASINWEKRLLFSRLLDTTYEYSFITWQQNLGNESFAKDNFRDESSLISINCF